MKLRAGRLTGRTQTGSSARSDLSLEDGRLQRDTPRKIFLGVVLGDELLDLKARDTPSAHEVRDPGEP